LTLDPVLAPEPVPEDPRIGPRSRCRSVARIDGDLPTIAVLEGARGGDVHEPRIGLDRHPVGADEQELEPLALVVRPFSKPGTEVGIDVHWSPPVAMDSDSESAALRIAGLGS